MREGDQGSSLRTKVAFPLCVGEHPLHSCDKNLPCSRCCYRQPSIASLILNPWLYLSTYWCQLQSGSPQDLNSNLLSDLPIVRMEDPEHMARRRRLPSKSHDIQVKMGGGNRREGRITWECIHLPGKEAQKNLALTLTRERPIHNKLHLARCLTNITSSKNS